MFLISVYFNLIAFVNRNSRLLQFNLADSTPDLHLLDTAAMTEMQGARLFYIGIPSCPGDLKLFFWLVASFNASFQ